MRIALSLAAALLFAAAPSAQSAQDDASADPVLTVEQAPDAAVAQTPPDLAVDLSQWAETSDDALTPAAADDMMQDDNSAGMDAMYYGSLIATVGIVAWFTSFFIF